MLLKNASFGNLGRGQRLLSFMSGIVLLLLLLLPQMSQQTAIGSFYTAGVVEFRQAVDASDDVILADNLAGYLEIIRSVEAEPTDIIVFPEATLNTLDTASYVPAPEQNITPCLDEPQAYYTEFLVALSCAARNVSKYIVINISEKQLCSVTPEDPRPCAARGYNIFNTNVVFDRHGVVVSRYRKVHLYGEPRNTTYVPEIRSFETDFGVTFGHFVCFDIMFHTPTQPLIDDGIRDFVYPTMWFSQMPFLTAVQFQQAWSHTNNVNLLAAGASYPLVGNTGTGIYHGRNGTITSVMNLVEGDRRIYVAQVPKFAKTAAKRNRRSLMRQPRAAKRELQLSTKFLMKRDHLENYNSIPLDLMKAQTAGTRVEHVCDGKLCCHFELSWRNLANAEAANGSYYSYRVGAYDGWRKDSVHNVNYVRNCAIFSCTGPSIEECGLLLNKATPHVEFTRLLIEATYPKSAEFLLLSNSLLDTQLPLEPEKFEWSIEDLKNGNQQQVRYALAASEPLDNLLTFAIYGNYFDNVCTFNASTPEDDIKCGWKSDGGGAANLRFSANWLLILLSLVLLIQLTHLNI